MSNRTTTATNKKRVNLMLSPEALSRLSKMAKGDNRSRSNLLDVLIMREEERTYTTPATNVNAR